MNKISALVIIILVCLVKIPSIPADGGIVIYDEDMWKMFDQEQQYCAINYHNGIQHMILTVNTINNFDVEQAVWVFPIPGNPENSDIDIMEGFPPLDGLTLKADTRRQVGYLYAIIALTQIRPFTSLLLSGDEGGLGGAAESKDEEITIYKSITKKGLTTELLSTYNVDSLSSYLRGKNLNLPDHFELILEDYIGSRYLFVISWISNIKEFSKLQGDGSKGQGNTLDIFISFPTDKIYYPLKPTSVYGNRIIPVVIYIFNHVQPIFYSGIKEYSEFSYYVEHSHKMPKELTAFYQGFKFKPYSNPDNYRIKKVNYTKVKINAPSEAFIHDLWFENEPHKDVIKVRKIVQYKYLLVSTLFILLIVISGLIAAVTTYKQDKYYIYKFVLLGFANCLTIIGFWVISVKLKIDTKFRKMNHISSGRRDFEGMEKRRKEAARMFRTGKKQAEVARLLGVSRQSVSRWHKDWVIGGVRALKAAGRAGRPVPISKIRIIVQMVVLCLLIGLGFYVNWAYGFFMVFSSIVFIAITIIGYIQKRKYLVFCSYFSIIFIVLLILAEATSTILINKLAI